MLEKILFLLTIAPIIVYRRCTMIAWGVIDYINCTVFNNAIEKEKYSNRDGTRI